MVVHNSPQRGFNLHLLVLIYIYFITNEVELLFMFTEHSCFCIIILHYCPNKFSVFFFNWVIFILLFKGVSTILVTNLCMCYR